MILPTAIPGMSFPHPGGPHRLAPQVIPQTVMALRSSSSSDLLLSTVAVGLLAYSIITRFLQWRRLRHIPRPPTAGWSKLWLLRYVVCGRLCTKLEELSGEYAAEPDPTGLRGLDVDSREPLVDAQVRKLVALLERKYLSTTAITRPCDLARTMQYLTQNTITAVGFGRALGYLDADRDIYGVIEACGALLLPMHILAFPTGKHGVGRFPGVIMKFVDERCDGVPDSDPDPDPEHNNAADGGKKRNTGKPVRRSDILQTFVGSGLRRAQVQSEALVTLFGGTDTTATGLRNTIFFLTANPEAYRALQAEIDGEVARARTNKNDPNQLVDDGDAIIPDCQALRLPYLAACIREGLRLWPPSMGVVDKQSDRDDVLCGLRVPAGTKVGWTALAVMKNRRVFGDNTDAFEPRRRPCRPARDGDRLRPGLSHRHPLGVPREEAGLFRRFDSALVTPMKPFQWVNHALAAQHNMKIRTTKRSSRLVSLAGKTITAKFGKWPFKNAVFKHVTEDGVVTFQLQFTWGPYAKHRLANRHARDDRCESPIREETDEEEWELERVINDRIVRGGADPVVEYRVRWKGFTENDNKWKCRNDLLLTAPDLVHDYDAKNFIDWVPGMENGQENLTLVLGNLDDSRDQALEQRNKHGEGDRGPEERNVPSPVGDPKLRASADLAQKRSWHGADASGTGRRADSQEFLEALSVLGAWCTATEAVFDPLEYLAANAPSDRDMGYVPRHAEQRGVEEIDDKGSERKRCDPAVEIE
ncbi:hypothetical protein DL769_007271 [Monosporascus sp. CRB-8-3]|nr:hypothetical protein DL769_007271 [Monosporascus sp. CRB-8-3]